jgi:hypothetical protein
VSNERTEMFKGYIFHLIANLENVVYNFLDDFQIVKVLRMNEFPVIKTRLSVKELIQTLERLAKSL